MRISITDAVLEEVVATIGQAVPETGGVLLGPSDLNSLTHFIFDEWAASGAYEYEPSPTVAQAAREFERRSPGLAYKGVVHSHPGLINSPSQTDLSTLTRGLRRNRHLPYLVAPILVQCRSRSPAAHELYVPATEEAGCALAFHILSRAPQKGYWLRNVVPDVVPVRRFLHAFGFPVTAQQTATEPLFFEGAQALGIVVPRSDGNWIITFPEKFPNVSPTVHAFHGEAKWTLPDNLWHALSNLDERAQTLRAVAEGRALAYGPRFGLPLTRDPLLGSLNGWTTAETLSGVAEANREAAYQSLFARGFGICAPDQIRGKRVLMLGVGSVGSEMARALARAGVDEFVLIDGDTVEGANLCRGTFEMHDLGRPKVEAAARAIVAVSPAASITTELDAVSQKDRNRLAALVRKCDLVIATTDDPRAQMLVNEIAHTEAKDSLFVGLFAAAMAGEIIWSIPGKTACFACASSYRRGIASAATPERDYGSGRLKAQPAVTADIMVVVQLAVKLALSLLLRTGDAPLGTWVQPLLARQATAGLVRLNEFRDPLFDVVLPSQDGEYGLKARWLSTADLRCQVCRARR